MKFKVVWEEERVVVVDAPNAIEAEEIIMNGGFKITEIRPGEITRKSPVCQRHIR